MLSLALSHGRLGHGHERDRFSPLLVSGLKGLKVHQVACGDYHTMAVIENGHVYSWGKGTVNAAHLWRHVASIRIAHSKLLSLSRLGRQARSRRGQREPTDPQAHRIAVAASRDGHCMWLHYFGRHH